MTTKTKALIRSSTLTRHSSTELTNLALSIEKDKAKFVFHLEKLVLKFEDSTNRRSVTLSLYNSYKKNLIELRNSFVVDVRSYSSLVENLQYAAQTVLEHEGDLRKLQKEILECKEILLDLQENLDVIKELKEGFGKVIYGKFPKRNSAK